jgi:hypothetical protein
MPSNKIIEPVHPAIIRDVANGNIDKRDVKDVGTSSSNGKRSDFHILDDGEPIYPADIRAKANSEDYAS